MTSLQINPDLIQIKERSFTSRTAILTHFVCPYKYYLMFEAHGIGYTSDKQSLDLLIGTVVHRGIQHLLEHCRKHTPDEELSEACIDEAVEVARELWEKELGKKSLALKSSAEYDRLDWIIAEQECLWEGLIRAFAIRKLPWILEEYEILEVEFEEIFENFTPAVPCDLCIDGTVSEDVAAHFLKVSMDELIKKGFALAEGNKVVCPKCEGTQEIHPITFLGKADALFMRKSDKALIVLSLKTCSEFADVTTRDILHDMQGVSETYLAQERIEKAWKDFHDFNYQNKPYEDWTDEETKFMTSYEWFSNFDVCPKIFAVQYEYLIKGKRRQDPYQSGEYRQQSFLCHPLKMEGIRKIMLGAGGSTINPDQYKWKWGAGKQAKGWEKTDIWNDVGIKTWINMLATGEVQAEEGHPFDHILQTPDLIVRSEEELKEWYVSTRFRAEEIRDRIDEINLAAAEYEFALENAHNSDILFHANELQTKLWQYFPKNTLSCHDYYGHDCQFVRHCHELEPLEDLISAGDMIPRIPHHELEKKTLIEKGLIEEND